jgi:hypothetical protein
MSEAPTAAGRELFVRHARKGGKSVAILRAVDLGESCVVEAQVFPPTAPNGTTAGPYKFTDARLATMFVTEAVEALMSLGCDVQAA